MRLFVAVLLPDRELARIEEALQPVRDLGLDVRWLTRESIHITLMFLGEVAEPRVHEIKAALAAAASRHTPFSVELGGFGAFPSLRRARVWWVGTGVSPELQELQKDVETALVGLGFRREERAYHAHLTVARAKPEAKPLPPDLASRILQQFDYSGQLHVDCVHLMRSHLQRSGARYESIGREALAER
jgi:2'-5' RNA ligase